MAPPRKVWLFDLDDTLHDATSAAMRQLTQAMSEYMVRELQITPAESDALRRRYWQRYGATLLGLVRHHGVKPAHFLHDTHRLPGLEQRVRGHAHDLAALRRLPGRKLILTNAPAAYARRVLDVLGIAGWFDDILSIEDMRMFGHLRPGAPAPRPDTAALTPRQLDVLKCLMQGQPNKLIARELGLTEGTVKIHIAAILRALQARNRTEAVVMARNLGLAV